MSFPWSMEFIETSIVDQIVNFQLNGNGLTFTVKIRLPTQIPGLRSQEQTLELAEINYDQMSHVDIWFKKKMMQEKNMTPVWICAYENFRDYVDSLTEVEIFDEIELNDEIEITDCVEN